MIRRSYQSISILYSIRTDWFPFNNLLITCDNYRSNNYKNSLLFDRKCCQTTTMTVVLISTSLLMWTLKFLLNFCSIYILIVVNAIVQNLHLSCYTTWKKSPWEGFVTKDYKYRMWFNNISFKKSKNILLIRQGNVDMDISWNSLLY